MKCRGLNCEHIVDMLVLDAMEHQTAGPRPQETLGVLGGRDQGRCWRRRADGEPVKTLGFSFRTAQSKAF